MDYKNKVLKTKTKNKILRNQTTLKLLIHKFLFWLPFLPLSLYNSLISSSSSLFQCEWVTRMKLRLVLDEENFRLTLQRNDQSLRTTNPEGTTNP